VRREKYLLHEVRAWWQFFRRMTWSNPADMDAELVVGLYTQVMKHLSRVWWDPNSALETGKLFNY